MNDNSKHKVVQTSGTISRITWLFVITFFFSQVSCSRQAVYPAPSVAGLYVIVDVTKLKGEEPQFFTYQYREKKISFFVIKIDDNIQSFLDACVSCYQHKQGYRYEDKVVVCRACNQRFPVYKLEKGIGNCYPIKIAGRMENGRYLIPRSSLELEADKF